MFAYSVIICLICSFSIRRSYQDSCPRIITNLNQKNCTDRATNDTSYYLDRSSCVPKCSVFPTSLPSGDDCSANPGICLPGYTCERRCGPASSLNVYSCEVDADCRAYNARAKCGNYCILQKLADDDEGTMCMAYHSNSADYVDKWWTAQKFKPVCDDDSKWVAKQCKGGLLGRCMCFSSTGLRLYGEARYSESANMTCACSRRKADLEATGRTYVSLHCDSMGNYEKIQCDVEKELCWCADPMTGDVTAPFVPSAAMKKLPCYEVGQVGVQYLRQCESKKYATIMINAKLKSHGVVSVEYDSLLCNADGSYGRYKVSNGIAYCTWRDNSNIGTWQANLAGMTEKLTCNCARDFLQYAHALDCEGTGNYVRLQQTTNSQGQKQYYCVDDDGFAKTELLNNSLTNCTLFY